MVKGKCSLEIDCINILSRVSGHDEGLLKMFPESRVKDKIRAFLWKKEDTTGSYKHLIQSVKNGLLASAARSLGRLNP